MTSLEMLYFNMKEHHITIDVRAADSAMLFIFSKPHKGHRVDVVRVISLEELEGSHKNPPVFQYHLNSVLIEFANLVFALSPP